jgi:subtilisin-like proprotein convertase family protein
MPRRSPHCATVGVRSCLWAAAGLLVLGAAPLRAAGTSEGTTVLNLDSEGPAAVMREYTNPNPITIPTAGPASLYPSPITVTGVAGTVSNIRVELRGFGHTLPDDLDLMLVSPRGTQAVFMSDAGGTTAVVNLTLSFTESRYGHPSFVPDNTSLAAASGAPLRGRNWEGLEDPFPTPAPATGARYSSTAAFRGEDPNGVWSLYVLDDEVNAHSGVVSGGWALNLSTSDANAHTLTHDFAGPATPYPHAIVVDQALIGRIEKVRVRLAGVSHDHTSDLDVLLEGPGGQKVMLMSDVGGMTAGFDMELVFDDGAPSGLPTSGGIMSGTYRPTNLGPPTDFFSPPAPTGPYGTALSVFNHTRPAGAWKLWVMDDLDLNSGTILNWGLEITVVNKGDFDRDDQTDILWRHDAAGQNVLWYMEINALRDGEFTAPPVLTDTRWQMVGTHDFNADGRGDILWRHATAGENVVWLMDKNVLVSGTFTTPSALRDVDWQMAGTGDFNGDARPDILWRHQVSGENVAWFMNGTTLTGGTFLVPASVADTNAKIVGTGYFNNDLQLDILWWHQGTGQLGVWFMNGVTMIAAEGTSPPGIADVQWRPVVTGDYNRDDREDIVWRHQVTGENMVWYMGGPNGTTRISSKGIELPRLPDTRWKIVGPR